MSQVPGSPGKRPTAVVVLAILNFIFGGLGILCGGTFLVMTVTGAMDALVEMNAANARRTGTLDQSQLEAAITEQVPSYPVVQFTSMGLDLLFSVVLVLAGFGLLRLAPWSRWLTIAYAILQIVHKVGMSLYSLLLVVPVMSQVMDEHASKAPAGFPRQIMELTSKVGTASAVATMAVTLLYPVLVLVVLFIPSVVAAFRARRAVPASLPSPPEGPGA